MNPDDETTERDFSLPVTSDPKATVVDLNIPAVRAAGARVEVVEDDLPETVVDLNLGAVMLVRDPDLDAELDRTEPVKLGGRQVPVPSVPSSMLGGEFDVTKV